MKWIIKYCLICIFLCGLFSIKAYPEDSVFHNADSLFRIGKFMEAATQYEWIYYFEEDPQIRVIAQIYRTDCYTQMMEFEQAQDYAEKITLFGIPDSLAFKIRYKRAFNAYLAENFNEAKSHFLQLQYFHNPDVHNKGIYYLYILILNELTEWDEASVALHEWIEKSDRERNVKDSLHDMVKNIYHSHNIPELKSIDRARAWSTFIPGTGQMYAGYFFEGLFNLTIHLATLAFAAEEIIHGFYITGYFGGFGLFQKFYFGGLERSEFLVQKTNYKRSNTFNSQVKPVILQIEKGLGQ